MKMMLKKYWLSMLLFMLGFACLAAYKVIGSSILDDGMLNEPFALIPLFWLFMMFGVSTLVITLFKKSKAKNNQ